LMSELLMLSHNATDGISREGLDNYIASQELGPSQQPPTPTPPPPGSDSNTQNTTTGANRGDMHATGAATDPRVDVNTYRMGLGLMTGTQPQAGGTSSAASGGQSSPGAVSQSTSDRLDSLDNTINQMTNQGNLSSTDQLKLQRLMEQEKEMFSMLSNISKMYDDMAMAAINNMR
jgi:hypothetical protein